MPSVSAVVLTKNSERTIESCIKALLPAVDYVTVVDTGSTDNTVMLAKECGARVYHFEWRDDFSAARNFGDSLATSDWVIHVDSDEILRAEDAPKIRKACAMFKKSDKPATILIQQCNVQGDHVNPTPASRMYKRGAYQWHGIIHEQLSHKRTKDCLLVETDIGFIHDGYDTSVVDAREKYMRNIELLKRGVEIEPSNVHYQFFLGRDYTLIGENQLAVAHLQRAVELLTNQNTPYQIRVHLTLIKCLEDIGEFEEAENVANSMVNKFDEYPEGWYQPKNRVKSG